MIASNHPERIWYETGDGVQIEFNSGEESVFAFSGFGAPEIQHITEVGVHQHGETCLDYRYQPRIIGLELRRQQCGCYGVCNSVAFVQQNLFCNGVQITCNNDDLFCLVEEAVPEDCPACMGWWWSAGKLTDHLRLNRGNGYLNIELCDGTTRRIQARAEQMPIVAWSQGTQPDSYVTQVRFRACNPFWEGDEATTDSDDNVGEELLCPDGTPAFDSFGNALTCPLAANALLELEIRVCATEKTFPLIEIHGPIDNPIVQVLPTNDAIALDYSLATGELVTIELRPTTGNRYQKTVTSSVNGNLIGVVLDQSSLATLCLAPHPIANNGKNLVRLRGQNVTDDTRIVTTHREQFLGVPL